MRTFVTSVLVWLALVSGALADGRDAVSATCRVRWEGGIGTGVAYYGKVGPDVYVMTARHVMNDKGSFAKSAACEFFLGSPDALSVTGTVMYPAADVDIVAIRLPKARFGGKLPAIVPLAKEPPKPGDVLISVGCRYGEVPTAFKTRVVGYRGTDMVFDVTPAEGRSGSAMFNADGTAVCGLLVARDDESRVGIAESVVSFVKAVGRKTLQCGPGGCPLPGQRINQFGAININRPIPTQPTPEAIPGWDTPGQPTQVDAIDSAARAAIDETRGVVNGLTVRVDKLDGGVAAAEKKADEASTAVVAVEKSLLAKIGSGVKSWVMWALGGLGFTGVTLSIVSLIAMFLLRNVVRKNAMAFAMKFDELTDKTSTELDDKLDGVAYRLAELLSGEKRPDNWNTPGEKPKRAATKKK